MFKNCGKSIMTLARVFFWIETIISWLAGVAVIVFGIIKPNAISGSVGIFGNVASQFNVNITVSMIIIGVLIIIIGFVISWLFNVGLFAAGQLIDDVHTLRVKEDF